MRAAANRLLVAGGFLILIVHFILLAAYQVKPSAVSFRYCYPYFHQDWRLFVPPPDCNYSLYWVEESKVPFDIFAELKEKHSQNRFSGKGPLLLALSNSIHFFEKQNISATGKVSADDVNFRVIERFAQSYLKERGPETGSGRLVLVVRSIRDGARRIYYR